jgi:hypothetical protein
VLGLALDETAGHRARIERTDVASLPVERFPQVHAMNRVAGKADSFTFLIDALIAGLEFKRRPRQGASRRIATTGG